MSTLFLKDLVVTAKHGVHQHEKENPQRFKVSVELDIDTSKAAISDDLSDTLNWSLLRQGIINKIENNTYNLIEKLADEVAKEILKDGSVQQVTVSIEKIDAFKNGIPGIKLTLNR